MGTHNNEVLLDEKGAVYEASDSENDIPIYA